MPHTIGADATARLAMAQKSYPKPAGCGPMCNLRERVDGKEMRLAVSIAEAAHARRGCDTR
ncbi:MAG: hypothetical protein IPF98_04850 [Gemmatimonadetes bacterium]|nr:hypothetical protein [Gemmatimonadota bacterium]